MTLLLAAALSLIQDSDTIDRKIQTIKVDANFNDTPLEEVADFIRDLAGINVLIDPEVKGRDIKVSLTAKGISGKTLLNLICNANDLGTKVDDGILVITTKEKAAGDVHLEIYDVQDIVMPIKNFPGREITFGDEGIQFIDQPDEPSPDLGDFLVECIRTFTGNKAWDSDKATITYQNGLLIIKQTKENHRRIQKILLQLRSLK
jgi:type II secretory pathway component GspD/PulD (secretin)